MAAPKASNARISSMILGFSIVLAGCGGSNSSSTGEVVDPPLVIPETPKNVQVVSGDADASNPQNTVSWTLDPDATGYTVYWAEQPGVTTNSQVLTTTSSTTRSAVHSGIAIIAGNSYYYRVKATATDGDSALSAEVVGTPQEAVTRNQLNDVAWNGRDLLVAVGDSGVILTSPNGLSDGWVDASTAGTPQTLSAVVWENVNAQFAIVGAGSTVLTGDGSSWTREDLSGLPGAVNLNDIAWLGDRYIAVGNNGTILTSNGDGSDWALRDGGASVANDSLNAVASNGNRIVVVGTNGLIVTSVDDVSWDLVPLSANQNLNDIAWDGSQFLISGSNDTILTSPDGLDWTSHIPGTSDINFVATTQWDSGLPLLPIGAVVGSSGTLVVNPDDDPGLIVRTGTTEQLSGITWVDNLVDPAYFVIVGNDGTVLTTRFQ